MFSSKLWTCLNECHVFMCTWSKLPNYYEVLKISRNSTQDDIKTAYYKLSKQYHPDKNTTKEAKVIFQKVSDAYEILGNFEKRRQYDRQLNIKGPLPNQSMHTAQDKDYEFSKFYRSRTQNAGPIKFDIDEWYRAHYSYTFMEQKKKEYKRYERKKYYTEKSVNTTSALEYLFLIQFVILFLTITLRNAAADDYDYDRIKRKDDKS